MTQTVVDPFTFEIIRHKLFRVTEEAAIALENASGTSITAEGHDLMVSLYRADGSLMVGGAGFIQHITSASQAVKHVLAKFSGDLNEDDVYLFNDPYSGALHAPDVYLIAPIFWDGRIGGFVAGFVHVSDIGGIDPGGFCPRARSCFEEGFATQGLKFVERGKLRDDVFQTILNVVRDPGIVALDLKSLMAAIHVAKERMLALYSRYGLETVDEVSTALVAQSEARFRQRLSELPDGVWRSRTYYEQEEVLRIELAAIKAGDTLTFDFTGTDHQVHNGVNCSYWATWGSLFATLFVLVVPDLVWNDGIVAPVRLIAPEGSLVNARRPAPVSLATIAMVQSVRNLSLSVISKMLGASNDYVARATATWAPTNMTYHLTGTSKDGASVTEHGTDVYAGCGGALSTKDGLDLGGQIHALSSRWANAERHETGFPYRYLYRRLVIDSGGPGKYRGGLCHEYAVIPHGGSGPVTAVLMPGRGMEAPLSQGLFGGYPGCNTACIVFRDGNVADTPHDLASTRSDCPEHMGMGITELDGNDILYIRHEGAAGYGDPLDRDPDLVVNDIALGLVSKEAAREVYGVVVAEGVEDPAGTQAERLRIRQQRLGGRLPEGRREGDARTRYRIGEYLQLDESGLTVECVWCGHALCGADDRWKDYAVERISPPSVGGPFRVKEGRFHLLEFFCPGCATVLDVDVAYGDDGPLYDTIHSWNELTEDQ
jgi:N-methylhydantoinase B